MIHNDGDNDGEQHEPPNRTADHGQHANRGEQATEETLGEFLQSMGPGFDDEADFVARALGISDLKPILWLVNEKSDLVDLKQAGASDKLIDSLFSAIISRKATTPIDDPPLFYRRAKSATPDDAWLLVPPIVAKFYCTRRGLLRDR